jgi:Fe-Mn family superoxide dismutase
MEKREFLKLTGLAGAGLLVSPFLGCGDANAPRGAEQPAADDLQLIRTPFELPPLGYAYTALEPAIDALTMEIHYEKHHGAYVKNLNKALDSSTELQGLAIDELMAAINPEDTAVRNNGGGHYNHALFWKVIAPGGAKAPTGKLADAINSAFGDFTAFNSQFNQAAMTRFGSGWAWLSIDENGKLFVSSTANQDNPHMFNVVEQKGFPILGIDVWEHAYYLNYQNRRGDYVNAFTALVNWDEVAKRYDELTA